MEAPEHVYSALFFVNYFNTGWKNTIPFYVCVYVCLFVCLCVCVCLSMCRVFLTLAQPKW